MSLIKLVHIDLSNYFWYTRVPHKVHVGRQGAREINVCEGTLCTTYVHQNTSQGITESDVRKLEKYLTRYHRVGCQGAREISC